MTNPTMTEIPLSELVDLEGAGLCFSVGPFPYVTGPGDFCLSIHVQF